MKAPLPFRPLAAAWALARLAWWSFVVVLARPQGRRPPHPSYVDAVWLRAVAKADARAALCTGIPHRRGPHVRGPFPGDRHPAAAAPHSPLSNRRTTDDQL